MFVNNSIDEVKSQIEMHHPERDDDVYIPSALHTSVETCWLTFAQRRELSL